MERESHICRWKWAGYVVKLTSRCRKVQFFKAQTGRRRSSRETWWIFLDNDDNDDDNDDNDDDNDEDDDDNDEDDEASRHANASL